MQFLGPAKADGVEPVGFPPGRFFCLVVRRFGLAFHLTSPPRAGTNSDMIANLIGNLTDNYTLTFDAWNCLVKVEDGETTVAEYEYDGLNHRTVKKTYVSGSLYETRHFYYDKDWRCLEERVGTSSDADRRYV